MQELKLFYSCYGCVVMWPSTPGYMAADPARHTLQTLRVFARMAPPSRCGRHSPVQVTSAFSHTRCGAMVAVLHSLKGALAGQSSKTCSGCC